MDQALRVDVLPAVFLVFLGFTGLFLALGPRHQKLDFFARRIAVGLIMLCLILAASNYLLRPAPALPVSITYAGVTNTPAGAHMALFTVTNHSKARMDRSRAYYIEQRPAPGHLNTAAAQSLPPSELPSSRLLGAGESESLAIPLPTLGPWRLVLLCGPYDLQRELNRLLAGPLGAPLPASRRSVSVSYLFVRGDWISDTLK